MAAPVFGYAISDIIAVSQLAWNLYRDCKGAPGEFAKLSSVLSTLHITLKELEDETTNDTTSFGLGSKHEAFGTVVGNVRQSLKDLETLKSKYSSLGSTEKRTWDRIQFAAEDLGKIRQQLILQISAINSFTTTLTLNSQRRVERVIRELIDDIRVNRRSPSILSAQDKNDTLGWNELLEELVGDGISREVAEQHKDAIRNYLKVLIDQKDVGHLVQQSSSEIMPGDSASQRRLSITTITNTETSERLHRARVRAGKRREHFTSRESTTNSRWKQTMYEIPIKAGISDRKPVPKITKQEPPGRAPLEITPDTEHYSDAALTLSKDSVQGCLQERCADDNQVTNKDFVIEAIFPDHSKGSETRAKSRKDPELGPQLMQPRMSKSECSTLTRDIRWPGLASVWILGLHLCSLLGLFILVLLVLTRVNIHEMEGDNLFII